MVTEWWFEDEEGSVTAWASVLGGSALIISLNRTASPLLRSVNRNDSKAGAGCEALFPLLNVRPSNELHGTERCFRRHRLLSYSRIFQHFMETEDSLPFSQVALYWSLSRVRLIQSMAPHPSSVRSILMLSSHLHLGLPGRLFSSGFSIKVLYALCKQTNTRSSGENWSPAFLGTTRTA
jgi:hypothetical protein